MKKMIVILVLVLLLAGCGQGAEHQHKFVVGDEVRSKLEEEGKESGVVIFEHSNSKHERIKVRWKGMSSYYIEYTGMLELATPDALQRRLNELNAWSRKLYKREQVFRLAGKVAEENADELVDKEFQPESEKAEVVELESELAKPKPVVAKKPVERIAESLWFLVVTRDTGKKTLRVEMVRAPSAATNGILERKLVYGPLSCGTEAEMGLLEKRFLEKQK